MKTISLKNSQLPVLVDDALEYVLSNYSWCLSRSGYAYYRHMFMHRELLGLSKGDNLQVDHIDCNKLNNQISNLRVVTRGENNIARRLVKTSTSGFKGVTKVKEKWQAQIKFNRKYMYLGQFGSAEEAAAVYDKKAVELFGAVARTNKELGV